MRSPLPPLDTPKLTPRERETVALAAQHDVAEVARLMGLQVKTVKFYLHSAELKHRDQLSIESVSMAGAPDRRPERGRRPWGAA
jgi:DNA-binding CsgD family transcriptional regulator